RDGRAARLGAGDRSGDHRGALPRSSAPPLRGGDRRGPVQQRGGRDRRRDGQRAIDRAARSGMDSLSIAYPIDLHTHSLRSDGALSPADLIRRAADRGVSVLSLSDHDTLAGVAEAVAAGDALGVRVIPASELNTESEWGAAHALGYFIDPADGPLEARLRWLRENRGRRIELMVAKWKQLGDSLSHDRSFTIEPVRPVC